MANRYWVGGTGTWSTSSTTHWSASTGGASGASVPTTADSVFFDQAGTYTVTCTGASTCLNITVSAGTVTFAAGFNFNIAGSMSLVAGTIWNASGTVTFSSTTTGRTITTNGVTFGNGNWVLNGVGGDWTLGSALNLTTGASLTLTQGTFSTGGYALTCFQVISDGSSTRTLNLTTSTITTATLISLNATGLTFNAGTSTINGGSTAISLFGSNFTYYNIGFTSSASINTHGISGSGNTFNNISVAAPSSSGIRTFTFSGNNTISGALTTTGTAGNRRVFFASATYGIGFTLTVNSAPSLTDADFRDIYVIGTATPISGTRIGNRGNCSGITFSTPKTVYWNLAGSQNWSANAWATAPTGTPSTNNFPLPQDTATFTNAGSATGVIYLDAAILYVPNVDMSGRTSSVQIGLSTATTVYGNWANGSGTSFSSSSTLTFSGGNTHTITSAGKTFSCPITIDSYGGTVQLADALNIGSQTLTVTNGTFNTAGFAVTADALSSSNSNVRTINLNASTISLGSYFPWNTTATNLTFNAGTSTINCTSSIPATSTGGLTFYNFAFTSSSVGGSGTSFFGENIFNNLTIASRAAVGVGDIQILSNQTINGTLTINSAGSGAPNRIFFRSDTIGTQRTLTVNSLSASDCDFRDIKIAGAAAGASPTRAGDCGNNSGITFPAPKTVYWNLAGTQNWSATAWATSSGGTPAVNNFPLAQDTAVFDNTGAAGTVTIDAAWNIGTFDASARTSAMTFSTSTLVPFVYGNWLFGTGVTCSAVDGIIVFAKNGTQTITSNGIQFGCPITINNPLANVQLADALSLNLARTLTLTRGTFDAVTYNVTTGLFSNGSTSNTLKMGSGTWTLSGTGTVWSCTTVPTIIAGTSTIVLSDTSTTARTFAGGGIYYNKLTIGGATGTSTTTINDTNTFGELASTKTVAHTIAFGTAAQTFGKWSITGTVGNVVTITGTSTANVIAGPAVTGIDYLVMGTWGISTTSPGEFYAGANSTGTAAAPVFRTAAPAPRTLYWVGGTGNWSSTTKWSTSSGGASGAAIPTSLDAVNFDSLSNATAYTATIDGGITIARCASFTMAGPAAGNVTFAGTIPIAFHGNVTFSATGITRTYAGIMNWAGNSSYTFTTNGVTLASTINIISPYSTWTLGSALSTSTINPTAGTFNTSAGNYAVTLTSSFSVGSSPNVRTMTLNGSTITSAFPASSALLVQITTNLTFNAGTSQITLTSSLAGITGSTVNPVTLYNVSFTSTAITTASISGSNTFNDLSIAGRTIVGIGIFSIGADQTINGTFTVSAGTAAAYRTNVRSSASNTIRTLTCAAVSFTDADFRDITILGAASPASGTRLGDAKNNIGITFPAAKTVYYGQTGNADWGATGSGSWSATSGGALDATMFPLAQDTAVFPAATYPASGSTATINAAYYLGTIDMSLRTSNTMTLATGTIVVIVIGNWINGTGLTLSGTGTLLFQGRTTQQITSVGRPFTQPIQVTSVNGSLTLQDALTTSTGVTSFITFGTLDLQSYTFSTGGISCATSNTRAIAFGTGNIICTGTGTVWTTATTGLTVTGTGTISLTSASAKTFAGGGVSFSGITLDHGGSGALVITGNNTFANISKTFVGAASSIQLGSTTQTVGAFTAAGTAGNLLTITGTSAASPATLIYTGSGSVSGLNYLAPTFIRAYPLTTWNAVNSTNGGTTYGWTFNAATAPTSNGNFFLMFN